MERGKKVNDEKNKEEEERKKKRQMCFFFCSFNFFFFFDLLNLKVVTNFRVSLQRTHYGDFYEENKKKLVASCYITL